VLPPAKSSSTIDAGTAAAKAGAIAMASSTAMTMMMKRVVRTIPSWIPSL
jgi:hypothetical protein